MTKKYRSNKSTTKKYKKKRGGEIVRDSEYGETLRRNVDHRDLAIVEKLNNETCDKAIDDYTKTSLKENYEYVIMDNKPVIKDKEGNIYDDKSQTKHLYDTLKDQNFNGMNKVKKSCKIPEDRCNLQNQNTKECTISFYNMNDPNHYYKLHSSPTILSTHKEPEKEENTGSEEEENTESKNTESMNLTDKMFILPCLQEREQLNEMEQQSSIIKNKVQTPMPDGNKVYYNYWYDTDYPADDRNSIIVPKLLANAMPSGKISLFRSKPTCRKFTTAQKWEMYGKWAATNLQKDGTETNLQKDGTATNLQKGGTALIVTHHNRMRGLSDKLTGSKLFDLEGGILPINDETKCNAYANNFCFRIHYDPKSSPKITTEIAFQGFPDKGGFDGQCDIKTGCTTGGGENYNYCCPGKNSIDINTEPLETGLSNANITEPITFYVIRHGNSIHNKPIGKKFIDSCLTPLGLYQAKKLGCFLKDKYKQDFNGEVILGTSFLCRTQLTGLAILNEIKPGGLNNSNNLNENLWADYDLLKKVSLDKFKAIAKSKDMDLSIFNGYAPVDNKPDDFYTYCCSKLKIDNFVPENDKPKICNSPPSDLAGGGKHKRKTRKNRRKKK